MSAPAASFKPLRYYRWALFQVRRLPELEREYYRQYCRSQFLGHSDEIHDERCEEVAAHGLESFKWILGKYDMELELSDGQLPWR